MYISNENCIHVVVVCRTFQNKHRCLPIVFFEKKNSDSSETKREKRTDAASNQNKTGNSCI